jgi:hypothetical protein
MKEASMSLSGPRKPSAGLFYMFCDEQRFEHPGTISFVTGHVAVPQDAWSRLPEHRRLLVQPSNLPRAARIQKLLHDLDGVAVITGSKIPRKHIPPKERDSTADIKSMARSDHIWSVTMAFGIVATLKALELQNLIATTVDVYYDSKALTESHRNTFIKVVTVQIQKSIQKDSLNKTRVRRFSEVAKAEPNKNPTKFQAGTLLADKLLKHASDVMGLEKDRLLFRDHSQKMVNYIEEVWIR